MEHFKLVSGDNNIQISNNQIICTSCNKEFSRKDALKRHINNQRCKKYYDYSFEKKYQENSNLKDENNLLRQELNDIKNLLKNKSNIYNSNINNTQNNIVINNLIVNHGSEDINKLTSDENKEILNSNSEAIYNIVKHIHYNPRLPEYNNVYINNLRSNSIYVMTDGKLIIK